MDDREKAIREQEIRRDLVHKKIDVAMSIVQTSSYPALDGEEWKNRRPIDGKLCDAAEAVLLQYLKADPC